VGIRTLQKRADVQHINLMSIAQNDNDNDEMNIDNNITVQETYVIGDKRKRATDEVKTAAAAEDIEMDDIHLDDSLNVRK